MQLCIPTLFPRLPAFVLSPATSAAGSEPPMSSPSAAAMRVEVMRAARLADTWLVPALAVADRLADTVCRGTRHTGTTIRL